MANTRTGNTRRARGNLGARIPATDPDPTTSRVNAVEVTVNANNTNDADDPNDATLIGKTMTGTTMMATPKVHTLCVVSLKTQLWLGTLINRIGQT
jgi:hypothetical protein